MNPHLDPEAWGIWLAAIAVWAVFSTCVAAYALYRLWRNQA